MSWSGIIANLQSFKPADLFDVLIIAFVIYQLLGFINRTRAGQLAKGFIVILAIYALSLIHI